MTLETKISLEILGNLTNQSLEWQFPDQKLSTLLVLPDFTKCHSSRTVTMRLLHSSSSWGRFTGSLLDITDTSLGIKTELRLANLNYKSFNWKRGKPWLQVASWEPFLQYSYVRFAWYGPSTGTPFIN